jgi:uncharacterized membrane protein
MRNRWIALRDRLRDNYWFIPMVLGLLAGLLAFITLALDQRLLDNMPPELREFYIGNPDGVRTILSTIAGSTITIVGLVFSLMMVVLTLASQQFGPLVITNFIRDRVNQFVLGVFVATFLYSMLVLRTVRGGDLDAFVPQISTLISLGLAVANLVVLVYFIHHIATSIRATHIINRIANNLEQAIDEQFPGEIGKQATKQDETVTLPADFETASVAVLSEVSGYLQLVDDQYLLQVARDNDIMFQMRYRPGDFILDGSVIGYVYPGHKLTDDLSNQINEAFYIGFQRTPEQDVELLFGQMTSIAVRVLSAAINDPYTALFCIDRLGQVVAYAGTHPMPSRYRRDADGQLRIITNPITFEGLVHQSFDEVYYYGRSDLLVVARLLRTIRLIGERLHDADNQAMLEAYATMIWKDSRERLSTEYAQTILEQAYRAAVVTLKD